MSVTGVSQYLVQYRFNNTNWVSQIVFRPDFEITNTEAGTYEFKVFSYNAALELSATSSDLTFSAVGKTKPPGNVQNLSMEPLTNKLVRLRWAKSVDPDVLHGGRVYVRHSNLTNGSGTFQNSVDLVTALAGNTTDVVVPSLEGEYILKFQDDQGNFSLGETSIIQDLPDLIDTQIIIDGTSTREDLTNPKFQGTKTNTTFSAASSGGTDALQLTDPTAVKTGTYIQDDANPVGSGVAGTTITITSTSHGIIVGEFLKFNFSSGQSITGEYTVVSVPDANTLTLTAANTIATSGNVSIDRGLRGQYEFKDIEDLGAVFSLDLKRVIRSVGFIPGQDIETVIPGPPAINWDDYALNGNFDGIAADKANCQIQVATSQTASGSFGAFNNFANGTFRGRRFKFKLILETTDISQNMNVQEAGFTAEFQSRTEQNYQTGGGTSTASQQSGTSAKTITFGTPFFVGTSSLGGANAFLPTVGITIQNAQSGDFFTVTNVSGTGFTVNIKNGSSFVDRTFTFQAVGYGKGV